MSALSAIYGEVMRLRRSWYDTHPSARRRLARPVISVGNLVVGGSGKTPVVAALARMLLERGERPAILSRGYARRRTAEGVVVVSDGHRVLVPVEDSGDEPQMLARGLSYVPVLVSPDRYLAGRLAEQRFGATVMLLDDGFQHLQLARTVDLLLVAPADLHERVLPSGRLRESLGAARSADAVLVYGVPDDAQRIGDALGAASVFTIVPRFGPLRSIGAAATERDGTRVIGVAGIGRPGRFFSALRERGYDVARELTFRDHHWFTRADVDHISRAARDVKADVIVTTEKDAARLEPLLSSGAGEPGWAVLPMDVVVEPAGRFAPWLHARLRHALGEQPQ